MTNQSPIKVFITGAANGLAEVREGLADHPDVELVGTAADPVKAGAKLAESAAQVILHGTTATEHVPTTEVEAIRAVTAAPIVLVTSASANSLLSEALQAGVHDVVLLPQLTDGIVFTIKKAHSLAAGRSGRRRRQDRLARRGQGRHAVLAQGRGRQDRAGLQHGRAVRPQASAADAPARPRPAVRRRRHHDGDRAGQDHLRPGHGPARARLRGTGRLRHRPSVGRARPAGAASARGRRAGHRGAPRPPVRRRQGELRRDRRRHAAVLPRPGALDPRSHRPAPAGDVHGRSRRSRTSSSRCRRSTCCTTRRTGVTCCSTRPAPRSA